MVPTDEEWTQNTTKGIGLTAKIQLVVGPENKYEEEDLVNTQY